MNIGTIVRDMIEAHSQGRSIAKCYSHITDPDIIDRIEAAWAIVSGDYSMVDELMKVTTINGCSVRRVITE